MAAGEVGKVGVAIDSLADMETLFDGIPLDKVSTSMTINSTGRHPARACTSPWPRSRGCPRTRSRGTIQNDILKEYMARGTYIYPPRQSMRIITDIFALLHGTRAQVEHHLHLRLPHPRGRLHRGAGGRLHPGRRHRLRGGRHQGRAEGGRFRPALCLLLQRPQQPAGGGGQVPRRPPHVGQDHEGALRRQGPQDRRCCASTPRPPAAP